MERLGYSVYVNTDSTGTFKGYTSVSRILATFGGKAIYEMFDVSNKNKWLILRLKVEKFRH